MDQLAIWLAFGAGVLSFLSPCCLPLYPSYISYISGISIKQLQGEQTKSIKKLTLLHTGFLSLVFP